MILRVCLVCVFLFVPLVTPANPPPDAHLTNHSGKCSFGNSVRFHSVLEQSGIENGHDTNRGPRQSLWHSTGQGRGPVPHALRYHRIDYTNLELWWTTALCFHLIWRRCRHRQSTSRIPEPYPHGASRKNDDAKFNRGQTVAFDPSAVNAGHCHTAAGHPLFIPTPTVYP